MSKCSSEDLLAEDKSCVQLRQRPSGIESPLKIPSATDNPTPVGSTKISSDYEERNGEVDTPKSSEGLSLFDSVSTSSGSSFVTDSSDKEEDEGKSASPLKTDGASTKKILVKTFQRTSDSKKRTSCQIFCRILYIMTVFTIRYYREMCLAFLVILSGLSSLKTG